MSTRGNASKKGSGYGGMRIVACPRCGGKYRKSSRQISSGYAACTNRAKCEKRRRASGQI